MTEIKLDGLTDHDLLIALNSNVQNLTERLNGYVPKQCIGTQHRMDELEKNMGTLANNLTWLWRLVVAGLVTIAIGKIGNWF